MLKDLRFRLRTLVRRGRAEDDLDDELRFHLERAVEQHVARGLSVREARRRARLAFGPIDAVKDDCRQIWGIRQLDIFRRDMACALRLIRKHPALSAIAAVSLAIGIGLNTTLFALVDATLLRRLPVDQPEQIVDVYASVTDGFTWYGSSHPDYLDLRDGARALAGLVGYAPAMAAVGSGGESRATPGEVVTGNYFRVLGVPAALGRALSPDDDRPGAAPVVMISAAFWSAAFAADPGAVGRTLRIGARPYTIVGVAPVRFGGMTAPILTPAFWVPMAWVDDVQPLVLESSRPSPGATRLERRGYRWMLLKGRLREGETAGTVAADLNGVMRALEAAYPGSNEGFRVTVVPTGEVATHPMVEDRLRAGAVSLVVLMGLVLLIVCANVAGLLLERASARRREIGLRLALGATRARLVRQLLVESAVLSLLGAAGGVALAWGLLQGLGAVRAPLLVPVALDLSLNGRVLGLSVAVALGAGVAAGLMPAWTGTRSSVLGGLAGGAAAWSFGGRRWSPGRALVTIQIAVSLVLLVMAGLLARNLAVAGRTDLGFPAEAVAAVTVGLGLVGYDDDEAARFLERARNRVRALPGVQAVAHASRAPLSVNFNGVGVAPAEWTGPEAVFVPVDMAVVGAGYFDALGVPVLAGRTLDDAIDTADSPPVAVVNEAFARRFWPDGSAVGQRIRTRRDESAGRDRRCRPRLPGPVHPGAAHAVCPLRGVAAARHVVRHRAPGARPRRRRHVGRGHAAGTATDRSGRGLLAGPDDARQRRDAVAAGAAALGDARDGRVGGRVAGRAGPVRRDRACGRAAHQGDRDPHGAGRDAPRRTEARRPAGRRPGGCRRRRRRSVGVRRGPAPPPACCSASTRRIRSPGAVRSSRWRRSVRSPTPFRRGEPCGWPRRRRCAWSKTAAVHEVRQEAHAVLRFEWLVIIAACAATGLVWRATRLPRVMPCSSSSPAAVGPGSARGRPTGAAALDQDTLPSGRAW